MAGFVRSRFTAAALAALVAGATAPAVARADTTPAITCTYTFSAWQGGFSADIAIANHGPAINGWTVRWTFAEPTTDISAWMATISVDNGAEASATNMFYNAAIGTGTTTSFGWSARAASTSVPTDLTINGVRC